MSGLNPGDGARTPRPTAAPRRAVHLHTSREGHLDWTDRGPAEVPERVLEVGRSGLVCDGVVYAVEDVFDDGRTITVWAREDRTARGAPLRLRRMPLPEH
jgi:hypothetical protein